jgi:hypothetical protein
MADVVQVIANDDGTYTKVYSDGTTETYDPLAMMNTGATPSQGTTTISKAGKAVPVQGAAPPQVDPAQASPTSAPVTTNPSSGGAWYDTGYQGHSSGGGSAYRGGGGYSGSSSGGGSGYGGGFSGSFGGGAPEPPRYADNTVPQYWGGPPRVPGGAAAQAGQGSGYDNRQQVSVPGGAAAGPFETRGAYPPSQHSYGGDSTSGGGGSNAGANSAIGQKLEAKVRGMADKIQGGGSSSSSTSSYQQQQHQYNQQGRQMQRASAHYNTALYHPDPLPVHGWSKQQGFKAGTIDAALADPTMLLPAVFPGYASGDNPFSADLESQPMTDLAMIMYGTQNKRGLTTKTPVVKVPHILAQNGTKPAKPATKRTLDPSAVTNKVAQMWGDLGQQGSSLESTPFLDRDTLLTNLATARRGSALRQGIRTQFQTDPGAALNSIRNYLGSAVTAGPDDIIHRALGDSVDRRITNMGPDLLRMKPRKASRFVSDLASSYLS